MEGWQCYFLQPSFTPQQPRKKKERNILLQMLFKKKKNRQKEVKFTYPEKILIFEEMLSLFHSCLHFTSLCWPCLPRQGSCVQIHYRV
jgi:hypothetical protein